VRRRFFVDVQLRDLVAVTIKLDGVHLNLPSDCVDGRTLRLSIDRCKSFLVRLD
jgi:hypothetical protein